jgi:hypothetical protein
MLYSMRQQIEVCLTSFRVFRNGALGLYQQWHCGGNGARRLRCVLPTDHYGSGKICRRLAAGITPLACPYCPPDRIRDAPKPQNVDVDNFIT